MHIAYYVGIGECSPYYALMFFMITGNTRGKDYFWMDGKSRILIVNFLGRIQVASKEKDRKAGGKAVQEFVNCGYFTQASALWP
jgi:hypothetical protein